MWHVGSLVASGKLLVKAYGIKFTDQGLNPCALHWELSVLATGPPGKFLDGLFSVLIALARVHPVHSEGPPIRVASIPWPSPGKQQDVN